MNEVDAGRDRATPASVRHDDDEPLAPISSDVWSFFSFIPHVPGPKLCWCLRVCVCVCVCARARARDVDMFFFF
jgi:hypothetical protein